jgi:hypothetical protein
MACYPLERGRRPALIDLPMASMTSKNVLYCMCTGVYVHQCHRHHLYSITNPAIQLDMTS